MRSVCEKFESEKFREPSDSRPGRLLSWCVKGRCTKLCIESLSAGSWLFGVNGLLLSRPSVEGRVMLIVMIVWNRHQIIIFR